MRWRMEANEFLFRMTFMLSTALNFIHSRQRIFITGSMSLTKGEHYKFVSLGVPPFHTLLQLLTNVSAMLLFYLTFNQTSSAISATGSLTLSQREKSSLYRKYRPI